VATHSTRGRIFTRRIGIVAGAMLLISFALGYLLHPLM